MGAAIGSAPVVEAVIPGLMNRADQGDHDPDRDKDRNAGQRPWSKVNPCERVATRHAKTTGSPAIAWWRLDDGFRLIPGESDLIRGDVDGHGRVFLPLRGIRLL
jgi:hypothetical protein